jgi:hypothetical protein
MARDHEQAATPGCAGVIHVERVGVARIDDRSSVPVRADLVGGRSHYSVGGEIREGPRWWRGHLRWPEGETPPRAGIEIVIELEGGRSAPAVIEPDPAEPEHTVLVHGTGPPPFDVP